MGPMQTLVLDALDQLGPMTNSELQTACLISPRQRGGFQSVVVGLFKRGLLEANDYQIRLSASGKAAPTGRRSIDDAGRIYGRALRSLASR